MSYSSSSESSDEPIFSVNYIHHDASDGDDDDDDDEDDNNNDIEHVGAARKRFVGVGQDSSSQSAHAFHIIIVIIIFNVCPRVLHYHRRNHHIESLSHHRLNH